MQIYKTIPKQKRTEMIKNDINELPKSNDQELYNLRDHFSQSLFDISVHNIIHGNDINKNIENLMNTTSKKGFNSDVINYQPAFINKIIEIFNTFLEPIDINNNNILLLINLASFLINMWTIKIYNQIIINESLISKLISLIVKLHSNKKFSINSIYALARLSSYIPTLVINFCTPEFLNIIITSIRDKSSYGLQKSSLELILAFCKSENVLDLHPEFQAILPPILVQAFNEEVFEISTKSLVLLFKRFGDISLAHAIKEGMIDNLKNPFEFYDKTKLGNSLTIVLFCIDRVEFLQNEFNQNHPLNDPQNYIVQNSKQIIDTFYCPKFVQCLVGAVPQHYSEPSFYIFNLIEKMMDKMWRIFFNEGLIEQIIIDAPGNEFHNKEYCASCITKFLEVVSSMIGDESASFQMTEKVAEYCSNWGSNYKHYNGQLSDDEDHQYENNDNSNYEIFINSLSISHVRYCVVHGGGLSFLISMLTSTKNSSLLKRMFEIIFHLILAGPPDFAQLAANENLLDNSTCIENEISENDEKSEDFEKILHIISGIYQFYHYFKPM